MTANYKKVRGVQFDEWLDEDEHEPSTETGDAELEEMYVTNGYLFFSIITDNRGMYFSIPIQARENWNDLVESLPRWE